MGLKFSDSQWKALQICIQSIITALLLFVQSFLTGCVSADNGANVYVDKNTEINIPVNIPKLEDLYVPVEQ